MPGKISSAEVTKKKVVGLKKATKKKPEVLEVVNEPKKVSESRIKLKNAILSISLLFLIAFIVLLLCLVNTKDNTLSDSANVNNYECIEIYTPGSIYTVSQKYIKESGTICFSMSEAVYKNAFENNIINFEKSNLLSGPFSVEFEDEMIKGVFTLNDKDGNKTIEYWYFYENTGKDGVRLKVQKAKVNDGVFSNATAELVENLMNDLYSFWPEPEGFEYNKVELRNGNLMILIEPAK